MTYIFFTLRGDECNANILLQALKRTSDKRGSSKMLEVYPDIITNIRTNEQLRVFWKKYQRDFDYAKDISFDDTCDTLQSIMDSIMKYPDSGLNLSS